MGQTPATPVPAKAIWDGLQNAITRILTMVEEVQIPTVQGVEAVMEAQVVETEEAERTEMLTSPLS